MAGPDHEGCIAVHDGAGCASIGTASMIALPFVDRPDLFDTAMPDGDIAVPRVRSFVDRTALRDVDKVPIA